MSGPVMFRDLLAPILDLLPKANRPVLRQVLPRLSDEQLEKVWAGAVRLADEAHTERLKRLRKAGS